MLKSVKKPRNVEFSKRLLFFVKVCWYCSSNFEDVVISTLVKKIFFDVKTKTVIREKFFCADWLLQLFQRVVRFFFVIKRKRYIIFAA